MCPSAEAGAFEAECVTFTSLQCRQQTVKLACWVLLGKYPAYWWFSDSTVTEPGRSENWQHIARERISLMKTFASGDVVHGCDARCACAVDDEILAGPAQRRMALRRLPSAGELSGRTDIVVV